MFNVNAQIMCIYPIMTSSRDQFDAIDEIHCCDIPISDILIFDTSTPSTFPRCLKPKPVWTTPENGLRFDAMHENASFTSHSVPDGL